MGMGIGGGVPDEEIAMETHVTDPNKQPKPRAPQAKRIWVAKEWAMGMGTGGEVWLAAGMDASD